jgi:hypothetical protein
MARRIPADAIENLIAGTRSVPFPHLDARRLGSALVAETCAECRKRSAEPAFSPNDSLLDPSRCFSVKLGVFHG